MIVRIDPAGVHLDEPDDCTRFHVQVAPDVDDVDGRLAEAGAGAAADDDHAWVRVDAVRALAAGRVGEGWEGRFDSMVGYAGSKGWLDEDGTAIRGHLERG